MTSEMILQEAIGLAREGRKTEARWLLEELLRTERANETAWLWYADCVETVDERVQALERCLRHNPDARRARAGLEMLRGPRKPVPAFIAEPEAQPPVIEQAPAKPKPVTFKQAASLIFLGEIEPEPRAAQPSGAGAALAEKPNEAREHIPAFELTPEDEWLLSDGAGVFTVSPDALTPEELEEMAARTEAFLAETRSDVRLDIAAQRGRKQEAWQDLERVTGSRAPSKRRKTAQAVEAGMSKTAQTTLAALAVVILLALALGAVILMRGL